MAAKKVSTTATVKNCPKENVPDALSAVEGNTEPGVKCVPLVSAENVLTAQEVNGVKGAPEKTTSNQVHVFSANLAVLVSTAEVAKATSPGGVPIALNVGTLAKFERGAVALASVGV